MIRRGPYGPSIISSSPMTEARVSTSGDMGTRASTPPLSQGSGSSRNSDVSTAIGGLCPVHPEGVDGSRTPKAERVRQGTIASLALLATLTEFAPGTGGPDVADDPGSHAGPCVREGRWRPRRIEPGRRRRVGRPSAADGGHHRVARPGRLLHRGAVVRRGAGGGGDRAGAGRVSADPRRR